MSINLKAKETQVQVGDLKGQYRYMLSTEMYNKLSESKVIKEAALRSGISRGVMQACWDAAGEVATGIIMAIPSTKAHRMSETHHRKMSNTHY